MGIYTVKSNISIIQKVSVTLLQKSLHRSCICSLYCSTLFPPSAYHLLLNAYPVI